MVLMVRTVSDEPPPREVVGALAIFALIGLLLLIFFLFVIYLMRLASRRAIKRVSAAKPPPTEASDVWAMHKTPDLDAMDDPPTHE